MLEMLETVTNLVPLVDTVNVPMELPAGLELFNVPHRIRTSINNLIPFITIAE